MGIVVGTVISVITLISMASAFVRSDPPPFSSITRVQTSTEIVAGAIKEAIDDLKIEMLAGRLFNYRNAQCAAIRLKNMELAATIGTEMQRARDQFFALKKVQYDIRPCNEF